MGENGYCTAKSGLKELINAHYGILSEPMMRYSKNDALVIKETLRKLKEEKEMSNRITLIGSIKHCGEAIMQIYNQLTLRGNIVYLPYMGIIPEDTDEDVIEKLHSLHRDKMLSANFVIVVDQDGYIGKDTQAEIKWCEGRQIQIMYASDLAMTQPAKSKK